MNEQLKLSDFLEQIQEQIRNEFSETFSVIAEIASMSGSRHLYFELIEKEDGKVKAKCRANLWAFNRYRVIGHFENVTRETLKTGMKVLFRVQAEFHIQYGFSLTIVDIDTSYSLGEFERLKQETINSLKNDGLLDLNKELNLPTVFKRLAVVTSKTAAGYEDFMQQLHKNPYGYTFKTQLFHCVVQGEKAPNSILQALDQVERDKTGFDAIILIRGGGSVIDLSCFDDYNLNFNLSQSSYPVLTGIGHDRDTSVADLVAHTFLKTPTAVAEFLIEHNAIFEQSITDLGNDISYLSQSKINNEQNQLQSVANKLKANTANYIFNEKHQTQYLLNRLHKGIILRLRNEERQLDKNENKLINGLRLLLSTQKTALETLSLKLEALNPETQFKRGYTLTLKNGFPINKSNIKIGDELETIGHEIKITSTVNLIE